VSLRIGIDVGGTFTDFVLLDTESGRLAFHKEPSTPHDPAAAVEEGVSRLLAATASAPADVVLVAHGTTVGLNAILQRRGARVGLVVSPGNGDILEIARVRMTDPYGFFALPEAPLVPRDHVLEIQARLNANGSVVLTPDDNEYERVAAKLATLEIEAAAVVLLNSYANPAFEVSVSEALAARLSIPVIASSAIWSEKREYERAMISVMNAYVSPMIRRYYRRLETNLRALGLEAPLSITTSNGGSVDIATASARPVDTLLSGPASGVAAAIEAARQVGISQIVTFDMGGTSADIALAEGSAPEITNRTHLGEIPLILPVVNVSAIGAGGGSIVRVDDEGFLKVGPSSVGAVPGPACFNKGGTEATITDCYLICGLLNADRFAAGRLPLVVELARNALSKVGARLGFSGIHIAERAADAALRVATSMMATEVRKALARRGAEPARFALVPYGGAGPTHAALLAEEAGLDRILLAARPGIFCALGAALANLKRDFVSSCGLSFGPGASSNDEVRLTNLLDTLKAEAHAWGASLADRVDHWRYEFAVDMRYADQAFDLTIGSGDFLQGVPVSDQLIARFHADHRCLYGFDDPRGTVDVSRVVVSLVGVLPEVPVSQEASCAEDSRRTRPIFLQGGWVKAQVINRAALKAGTEIAGPAIIEQDDTTIVAPAGWVLTPLEGGDLLMSRLEEPSR
jgi:N-methylhydantoinase A